MNKYIASFKVLKTGHWHSEYFMGGNEDDIYRQISNKYGYINGVGIKIIL